jgi:hypothetical protein
MHRLVASLACLWLAMPSFAQAPAAWSTLAFANAIDPNAVVSIGKLSTYREGNQLHVHSAFTRRWHVVSFTGNPTLRLTNDCLLLQDGAVWTAFAALRGTFEPLSVSPQAQLLNPAGRDNDSILLVQDGGMLHAFSGFTGTWVHRPIGSNFAWSTQRHVAIVHDGTMLTAMDAFSGTWHDLPGTPAPNQLSTDGNAALAIGNTAIAGFSASTASWQVHAPFPGATLVRRADWLLLYDANQALAYSGTRGAFAALPQGITAVPNAEDCFCLFETSQGLCAYSAIRNAFTAPLAPIGARVRSNVAVATLVDGPFVHGYSATRNTVATAVFVSNLEESANTVAFAIDQANGVPRCFSALTGQWHTPPAGTLAGAPSITTTMLLLPTANGIAAFSARSGSFVPLAGAALTPFGNSASAVGGAYDANALYAFDGRTDSWLATPRTGTGAPSMQIWRTALFAIDGTTVHGFGTQGSVWTSALLPEPLLASRANSESSRIVTDHFLLAHSALAELVASTQFPDFRRVFAAGTTARFYLPLGTGDLALFAAGLFAAPQPVPGFGTLWLLPNTIATQLVLPGGDGRAVIPLPVPSTPSLVGTEWGFQALVAPATGSAYLTGPASLLVL